MEVYHGSLIDIKDDFLKPNKAFNNPMYEPCVYFTELYNYALLYSANPIGSYILKNGYKEEFRAFSAHINFNNTIPIIYELYSGMFEDLFNIRTFVYVSDVEKGDFAGKNKETKVYCKVKIKNKIVIPNFYDKLCEMEKNNEVVLKRFETWDDWDYYNFIDDHILTKVSSSETCGELKFYREKFPDHMGVEAAIAEAKRKRTIK